MVKWFRSIDVDNQQEQLHGFRKSVRWPDVRVRARVQNGTNTGQGELLRYLFMIGLLVITITLVYFYLCF